MLSPSTPKARSAMISPTVCVMASATAWSEALVCFLVRCSKLASSSLSDTLRMRSSHNSVPERLSIISRAVIGLLPAKRDTCTRTGQSGSEGDFTLAKRNAEGKS